MLRVSRDEDGHPLEAADLQRALNRAKAAMGIMSKRSRMGVQIQRLTKAEKRPFLDHAISALAPAESACPTQPVAARVR